MVIFGNSFQLFRPNHPRCSDIVHFYSSKEKKIDVIQWKLDLADTSLAENFDLKDTLKKIWVIVFDF